MSKFKRTDKKRPILVNKQTKIFDLFPGGVYGSGLKVKDFKGFMKSRKKNKMGGVIKASTGEIVTPRMSRYVADTLKKPVVLSIVVVAPFISVFVVARLTAVCKSCLKELPSAVSVKSTTGIIVVEPDKSTPIPPRA